MGAVVTDAAEAIIVVRCIFRCDLDPSCVCSRGQQHTFVLMEGEYIERLNARLSDEVLVSLKIRTSLRSSQWIGSGQCEWQQSKLSQLDEIRAPQGYCISSLFGSHIRERCYQVGCTFEPLTRSSRIDPIPFFNSQRKTSQYRTQVNRETSPSLYHGQFAGTAVVKSTKTESIPIPTAGVDSASFYYSHDKLRAIVTKSDDHLQAISIVTSEQFTRYLRDRDVLLAERAPNRTCYRREDPAR